LSGLSQALNEEMERRLAPGGGGWLFLDYDGTLADFAPTPDIVIPNDEVIRLISQLAEIERVRVTILSGRRLAHIRELLPVAGVMMAGTYGLEIEYPAAGPVPRVDAGLIRPTLNEIATQWITLIAGKPGFYLEDKGLALALHARHAEEADARQVLAAAQDVLEPVRKRPELFRIMGGHRFLEVGPAQAGKGASVAYLLERYALPDSFPVFVGDDDKDEEAFQVVRDRGGVTVVTASAPRPSIAEYRLRNPGEVRAWLGELIALLHRLGAQNG
jgi:trehalose 6-phosphate phosphatase